MTSSWKFILNLGGFGLMTNDDERGEGGKNAENLMTSYVNDPL